MLCWILFQNIVNNNQNIVNNIKNAFDILTMFNHNIVKKNCLQYYQVNRYCQQCFNLGLEYDFKCFLPGIQCSKCCTISSTMSLMVQLASASGELSEASLARKEILNKSAHSFAWISSNCQINLEFFVGMMVPGFAWLARARVARASSPRPLSCNWVHPSLDRWEIVFCRASKPRHKLMPCIRLGRRPPRAARKDPLARPNANWVEENHSHTLYRPVIKITVAFRFTFSMNSSLIFFAWIARQCKHWQMTFDTLIGRLHRLIVTNCLSLSSTYQVF